MQPVLLITLLISLNINTAFALPLQVEEIELKDDNTSTTLQTYEYSVSSKVGDAITDLPYSNDDHSVVDELNEALTKLVHVYMQALFSGTHTPELAKELGILELELFDLLDTLYNSNRMAEFMKYEAEVTHKMIIYNLLKKLFGYAKEAE